MPCREEGFFVLPVFLFFFYFWFVLWLFGPRNFVGSCAHFFSLSLLAQSTETESEREREREREREKEKETETTNWTLVRQTDSEYDSAGTART